MGNQLLTFQGRLFLHFQGLGTIKTQISENETTISSETSLNIHQSTQYNIPDNTNLHHHCYNNFKLPYVNCFLFYDVLKINRQKWSTSVGLCHGYFTLIWLMLLCLHAHRRNKKFLNWDDNEIYTYFCYWSLFSPRKESLSSLRSGYSIPAIAWRTARPDFLELRVGCSVTVPKLQGHLWNDSLSAVISFSETKWNCVS